jgi:integrase
VTIVIDAFWRWVQDHYRRTDGSTSPEVAKYKSALRYLNRLYGPTPAAEFGALALEAVRAEMLKPHPVRRWRVKIDASGRKVGAWVEVMAPGYCRTSANALGRRLVKVFKWAAKHKLVSSSVYHELLAVDGLRKGYTQAREGTPVKPAREEDVAAVLELVSPQVRAMMELEAITGMRPGEVRTMRPCDIEMRDDVWIYRPARHKTEHHGDDHTREIFLGPRARKIVEPFVSLNPQKPLFSPRDAEAWRNEQRRKNRKTPMTPSQARRAAAVRPERKRPPAAAYNKDSYNHAIRRACERAGLGRRFTPNQLRHAAATRLRREFGLEAAQVILGHRTLAVTQVYAEKNVAAAVKIMGEVG